MRKQFSFCHFKTICFPKWFQVNWSLVLSLLFSNLFCVRFAGTLKWPSRWEALLHSRKAVSLPPQRWLQTARVQISRKHFLPLKRFFFLPGIFFCGGGGSVCRVAQKEEESWEKGNWGEKKGERPKPRCLLLRLKVQNSPRFPAKKSGGNYFFTYLVNNRTEVKVLCFLQSIFCYGDFHARQRKNLSRLSSSSSYSSECLPTIKVPSLLFSRQWKRRRERKEEEVFREERKWENEVRGGGV